MPGSTDRPFASPPFQGRSANGPYGDSIEELDWSAGEILKTLKSLDLDENTLVIWTSDNGAVERNPPQGRNTPLRGWGYDVSEGGQRVPCLIRWPGHLPGGVLRNPVCTMMDILPTVARLAGATLPADCRLDGHDICPLLTGESDTVSPYDEEGFFYYFREQLQAVRSGPWKLYLPLEKKMRRLDGRLEGAMPSPAALYNLRDDIRETREVSAAHPEVVRRLMALADRARADLGDLDRPGTHQRPAGWVEHPRPLTLTAPE